MDKRAKWHTKSVGRRWGLIIGVFIVLQVVFVMIDGTGLEPNVTDSDRLVGRMARGVLDAKLFTEWINPYSYPFFNFFSSVYAVAAVIQAAADLHTYKFAVKRNEAKARD